MEIRTGDPISSKIADGLAVEHDLIMANAQRMVHLVPAPCLLEFEELGAEAERCLRNTLRETGAEIRWQSYSDSVSLRMIAWKPGSDARRATCCAARFRQEARSIASRWSARETRGRDLELLAAEPQGVEGELPAGSRIFIALSILPRQQRAAFGDGARSRTADGRWDGRTPCSPRRSSSPAAMSRHDQVA